MSVLHFTTKQTQILGVIAAANPDGSPVDLDELLDRLPYETSKQSIHFSIRALVARGMIKKDGQEKRRGRRRMLISLAPAGVAMYAPVAAKAAPSFIATPEEDAADELFDDPFAK